jgi:hypothetical protein
MGRTPEEWAEHTEIVPRVVYARRARAMSLLAAAAVGFSLAGATLVIPKHRQVDPSTIDAIAADAQRLGVLLHAALKQTLDRAEGFAGTPVLEAGILTDAATVLDIVKTEYRLRTRPGETLELFQVRGDAVTSLVRVPPEAAPIAFRPGTRARIESRDGLAVVVTAEVTPYNDAIDLAGQLAVAVAFDADQLPLAQHAVEVNLVGAGAPISLVSRRGSGGPPVTAPVPLDAKWQLGPLALHAVPVLTARHAGWVLPLRSIAFVLGAALLCTFFLALRSPRR